VSLAVDDLMAARAFYEGLLGCPVGRVRDGWLDVDFFGAQLTLHERPEALVDPGPDAVRHVGVALDEATWRRLVDALRRAEVPFIRPPTTEGSGTPTEQSKAMVADPSGNAVELKHYPHPDAALGPGAPGGAALAEPPRRPR
jgi:extradiol dioxygenase family protein